MKLANRSVLITGAGTGIGRACAIRFAREGARVVVADIRKDTGEQTAREIADAGGTAEFVEADVSRREDNERIIDFCFERFGSLDILFCNAGVTLAKLITESSEEEVARVMDVNFTSIVHATRYAVPIMLSQPTGGVILVNASKTGIVAQVDSPIYNASKGAAILLAKSLALDYATKGIRVNALCPGIIDTPLLRQFANAMPDPDAAWASYVAAQPMGRLGTVEECADAALWLVSDEASFVTGVALTVDGGFTAM